MVPGQVAGWSCRRMLPLELLMVPGQATGWSCCCMLPLELLLVLAQAAGWFCHCILTHPTRSQPCRLPPPPQCNVFINQVSDQWKQRVSIIVYAMVIVATVGWVLFMVFGAIGIVMLPMDWIREFIGRPKATITRSQYIDRARDLARRAKVGGSAGW